MGGPWNQPLIERRVLLLENTSDTYTHTHIHTYIHTYIHTHTPDEMT